MLRSLSAALLLAFTAGRLVAQDPGHDTTVAKAMRAYSSRYIEPDCKLAKGHFLVSSGATYLQQSIEKGSVEANRQRLLNDGERVLLKSIRESGQAQNPAAWYYLGRIYLQRGDVAGADSALSKAAALAPECDADIAKYRKVVFAPVVNQAIAFSKNGLEDSAIVYYRKAMPWNPSSSIPAYNLASIYTTRKMDDSALVYYDQVLKLMGTGDTANIKVRNQTAYNRAVLLARTQRYPEAIVAFRQYLTWAPDDVDAKKGLMQSFRGAGMADSAKVIEAQLGVSAPSAEATGAAADYNAAVTAFNDQQYAAAAAAAEKFLATEPYNREALYVRAFSHYQLKHGPALIKAAQALLAVDPMNESSFQLLGSGYAMTRNSDMAVKTRMRLNALPVSVASVKAEPTGGGVALTAIVTGRNTVDAKTMKPVAPAPVTLVYEFLDPKGTVVATQEATVPALKAGEQFNLKLEVQGQGVTGWRYHAK